MATLRTIRLRIKGTKNIKQITRAMEAVSAVKMRKSQQVALATRPYALSALKVLRNLRKVADEKTLTESPLLHANTEGRTLLVVVTSDKGLAGPFNANVLKQAENFIKSHPGQIEIATVGKKAGEYFSRRAFKPVSALTGFGDFVELQEVMPLYELISEKYLSKQAKEVHIIYTNFLGAMKQEVVTRQVLPINEERIIESIKGVVPEKGKFSEIRKEKEEDSISASEYIYEPSPKEIFDTVLPALLKTQVYHCILEANASEHSSRMIAMRNATDNATELIKKYTVVLNKARQSAINKELAEISGGAEALAN